MKYCFKSKIIFGITSPTLTGVFCLNMDDYPRKKNKFLSGEKRLTGIKL